MHAFSQSTPPEHGNAITATWAGMYHYKLGPILSCVQYTCTQAATVVSAVLQTTAVTECKSIAKQLAKIPTPFPISLYNGYTP